jgi:glycine hydroxymethyltransferase
MIHTSEKSIAGVIKCEDPFTFILSVPGKQAGMASAWLRDLSDGYIKFDQDLAIKVPGSYPDRRHATRCTRGNQRRSTKNRKPYYIGMENDERKGDPLTRVCMGGSTN